MNDRDCVALLQWALPRLGLHWPGYRRVRRQVCKRVHRRMRTLGLDKVADYRLLLDTNAEEWQTLDRCCCVTISRFCRDRGAFDALGATVLPSLAAELEQRGGHTLKVWSAGCASGEEPYSLSLLWDFRLQALFPNLSLDILATDIEPRMLARAQNALFGGGSLKDLPPGWRDTAFDKTGERWRLKTGHRRAVRFALHDVRHEAPDGPFHLVLCRNLVFTYFDPDHRSQFIRRLQSQLVPGAALMLGRHEILPPEADAFVPWNGASGVWRFVPEPEAR